MSDKVAVFQDAKGNAIHVVVFNIWEEDECRHLCQAFVKVSDDLARYDTAVSFDIVDNASDFLDRYQGDKKLVKLYNELQESSRKQRVFDEAMRNVKLSKQIDALIKGGFSHEEIVDRLDLTAVQLIDELMAATVREHG